MEILAEGALPIYSWAPDLEDGARRQARNCTELPVAHHHVAIMADGHEGYGVPIGAVMALEGAIAPYAVGNDIGCGMALVPTTITREEILAPVQGRRGGQGPAARDEIMGWVKSAIPTGGRGERSGKDSLVDHLLDDAFDAMEEASAISDLPLSTSQSPDSGGGSPLDREIFLARGHAQAGTLGAGNHFLELLAAPEGTVWVLVHSGSRGIGALVCNNFHRMARAYCDTTGQPLPDQALAWLPVGEGEDQWNRVGNCYERALRSALAYAQHNRRRMLETVAEVAGRRFPGAFDWDGLIDLHHNDATYEEHYGCRVWVHRKGAVKAAEGEPAVIPGSMGTGSYLGRGLGRREAFCSCAHGAGRAMSRGRARQQLSLQAELAAIAAVGGKVFAHSREAVLDEMPGAYKDLEATMAAQADLVEPVRRFTPLATYKGSEGGRRRRRGRPGAARRSSEADPLQPEVEQVQIAEHLDALAADRPPAVDDQ
jgi:tRNA-splicing ligase RtcB